MQVYDHARKKKLFLFKKKKFPVVKIEIKRKAQTGKEIKDQVGMINGIG